MSRYYDEVSSKVDPWRNDGWENPFIQLYRFCAVLRSLRIGADASILDLGCGTGAFLEVLGDSFAGTYLGVDRRTLTRHQSPNERVQFLEADIYSLGSLPGDPCFEYCLGIGSLVDGHNLTEVERLQRLRSHLSVLHERSSRGGALFVLDLSCFESNCFRGLETALVGARKGELERMIEDLGPKHWSLDGEILPEEFLLVFTKEEKLNRLHSEELIEEVLSLRDWDPLTLARAFLRLNRREQALQNLQKAPWSRERELLKERLQLLV